MDQRPLLALLAYCVAAEGQALYIAPNKPPWIRRADGTMAKFSADALSPDEVRALCESILTQDQIGRLTVDGFIDFDYGCALEGGSETHFLVMMQASPEGIAADFRTDSYADAVSRHGSTEDPAPEFLNRPPRFMRVTIIDGPEADDEGGIPVPMRLGPEPPGRSGRDAKALPPDLTDENPAAQ